MLTSSSSSSKIKAMNGNTKKFIFILVVIAIVVGGFLYYQKQNNSSNVSNQASGLTITQPAVDKDLSEFFPNVLGGKNIQKHTGYEGFAILPAKIGDTGSFGKDYVKEAYETSYISDPYVEDKFYGFLYLRFKSLNGINGAKQIIDEDVKKMQSPAQLIVTDIPNSWLIAYNDPSRKFGQTGGKDGLLIVLFTEAQVEIRIEMSGVTQSEMIKIGQEYVDFVNRSDPYEKVNANEILTDLDRYDAMTKSLNDIKDKLRGL